MGVQAPKGRTYNGLNEGAAIVAGLAKKAPQLKKKEVYL
jgi:hypothetical protein